MKVRANCRINHGGEWHVAGDVFDMTYNDVMSLGTAVTVLEEKRKDTPVVDTVEEIKPEAPRRGRRKKTEE